MLKPYSIEETLTINGLTFTRPNYIDLFDEEKENKTCRNEIRDERFYSLWLFLKDVAPAFQDDIILHESFLGRKIIKFYDKKQKFTEDDFVTWYWKKKVAPIEHFSFDELKGIDADKVIQYCCERQIANILSSINTIIEQLKE